MQKLLIGAALSAIALTQQLQEQGHDIVQNQQQEPKCENLMCQSGQMVDIQSCQCVSVSDENGEFVLENAQRRLSEQEVLAPVIKNANRSFEDIVIEEPETSNKAVVWGTPSSAGPGLTPMITSPTSPTPGSTLAVAPGTTLAPGFAPAPGTSAPLLASTIPGTTITVPPTSAIQPISGTSFATMGSPTPTPSLTPPTSSMTFGTPAPTYTVAHAPYTAPVVAVTPAATYNTIQPVAQAQFPQTVRSVQTHNVVTGTQTVNTVQNVPVVENQQITHAHGGSVHTHDNPVTTMQQQVVTQEVPITQQVTTYTQQPTVTQQQVHSHGGSTHSHAGPTVVHGEATAITELTDPTGTMLSETKGLQVDSKIQEKLNDKVYVFATGDINLQTAQAQSHNAQFYAQADIDKVKAQIKVDNRMGLAANGWTSLGKTEGSIVDNIVTAYADTPIGANAYVDAVNPMYAAMAEVTNGWTQVKFTPAVVAVTPTNGVAAVLKSAANYDNTGLAQAQTIDYTKGAGGVIISAKAEKFVF